MAPTGGDPLADLFSYLERQQSSGALEKSRVTEITLQHRPDPGDHRLREGYDCDKTVTLLIAAEGLQSSADAYDDAVEALSCAALVYTAFVDALAPPRVTRWSVHEIAYALFTRVLEEGFSRKVHLDGRRQRRLYREAIATAQRLAPKEDPLESQATESLLLLMKEYQEFLEH